MPPKHYDPSHTAQGTGPVKECHCCGRFEGMTEEAISLLPTEPGECPYCKTPLIKGELADGRPVRVCVFSKCLYGRTGQPFRQAEPRFLKRIASGAIRRRPKKKKKHERAARVNADEWKNGRTD